MLDTESGARFGVYGRSPLLDYGEKVKDFKY
mgnify:CR=1 FL=1